MKPEGFMDTRRRFSRAFKLKAVRLKAREVSVSEAAKNPDVEPAQGSAQPNG